MYNRTTPYLAPGNMDSRNQTAHLGQYWHCYPNPRKPDNGINSLHTMVGQLSKKYLAISLNIYRIEQLENTIWVKTTTNSYCNVNLCTIEQPPIWPREIWTPGIRLPI